ncbi:hypothetical protein GW930_03035 [Candidatus Saccharibacteria bacterium]|nr:hypothetical protein [Candidatus Saccharibacteria bacterium]
MFTTYINPSILALTLSTAFGVLVHDTHLDRMATVAIGAPAVIATYAAADQLLKKTDHTHVDRGGFTKQALTSQSKLPRVQPRDDARNYMQSKKSAWSGDGNSNARLWPSI